MSITIWDGRGVGRKARILGFKCSSTRVAQKMQHWDTHQSSLTTSGGVGNPAGFDLVLRTAAYVFADEASLTQVRFHSRPLTSDGGGGVITDFTLLAYLLHFWETRWGGRRSQEGDVLGAYERWIRKQEGKVDPERRLHNLWRKSY